MIRCYFNIEMSPHELNGLKIHLVNMRFSGRTMIGWCPAVMLQISLFIGGFSEGKQEVLLDTIKLAHIKG